MLYVRVGALVAILICTRAGEARIVGVIDTHRSMRDCEGGIFRDMVLPMRLCLSH